ncbi:MAG: family 16 glycoside hydrolase [Terriglobia bacterium]
MKRFIVIFCCLICVRTGQALGSGAKPSGWVSIMPQASLEGWTRVAIPPSHPLNPASQRSLDAAHHVIMCKGNGGHEWLRYDHKYKDFVFEAQWRLAKVPGAKHYNSGVFIRNNEDGSIWYQGQVGSDDGGYFFGITPRMARSSVLI